MQKKQKIIFLHIPKTAGLSMASIIKAEYKREEIFYINYEKIQGFIDLPFSEKERINIVIGHQTFGNHKHFAKDVKYITLFRNPIDRVVSMYYFIKRRPQNKFYEKINSENISLEDFIINDEVFRQVFNSQTKLIAGLNSATARDKISEKTYEKAIENIDNNFVVAGLTERFDESILLMKNELNWSYPFYVKKNVAKKREKPSEVSDEIKMLIAERNEYDIRLYNYVKENFQKKIDQNKEKFKKQLKEFTLLNSISKPYQIVKQTVKNSLKEIYHKIKK